MAEPAARLQPELLKADLAERLARAELVLMAPVETHRLLAELGMVERLTNLAQRPAVTAVQLMATQQADH